MQSAVSTQRTTASPRPRLPLRAARRPRSIVAPLGAALALALAPTAAPATPSRSGSVDAIRAVLARRAVDARTRVEVLAELTRLGPGTIPDLFDVYTGRSLAPPRGDGGDARRAWWCDPEVFPELALAALAELPPARVVSHLAERTAGAGVATRLAALDVLGALRSAAGLELWLRQAEELGGAARTDPRVREALLDALASILEEPGALRSLEERLAAADAAILPLVARAAARASGPATNAFLIGLLGRSVACDRAVLDGVVRRGARFPWRLRDESVATIRRLLFDPDPQRSCAAASALGRLGDVASVPDLLGLLDARHPGVRQSAAWALRRLSGRRDLDDHEWAAWYASERRWWHDRGAALLTELADATPGRRADIVRTLARHPLERPRTASALVALLPHADAEHAPGLCRALADLGSPRAVPALVTLLYERDAATRGAAYDALRALTGHELPPEPPLWSSLVAGRQPW